MTSAYVLVNTEPGMEKELCEKLQYSSAVKESHIVFGIYDVIVKVEAESPSVLKDSVFKEIRRLEEVRTTLTMVVSE
jgi:DNA-binding Lrp family transcriptional regulator